MNTLRCWLLQVWRGVRVSWLIQLAATGSIMVGLVLVGLTIMSVLNLERLTHFWGQSVQIIVYLHHQVTPSQASHLTKVLKRHPEVMAARYISPATAHSRLSASLGPQHRLLDDVEHDFFPASLELKLSATSLEQQQSVLALLRSSPLVEEIDNLGQWTERLNTLVSLMRTAGLAITIIVCLACLYIISSTIRLGVFVRREEINILKLIGATDRFIKVPFLIEGALQGLCGALAACGLLLVLFLTTAPRIEQVLSGALSHLQLNFLSSSQLAVVITGGALLGLIGSRVALSKHLEPR